MKTQNHMQCAVLLVCYVLSSMAGKMKGKIWCADERLWFLLRHKIEVSLIINDTV